MTQILTPGWQPIDADGLEELTLTIDATGFHAESMVIRAAGAVRLALRYVVTGDARWHTRRVEIAPMDSIHTLVLESDGAGHWRDGTGKELPALYGALDADFACTPFTNTLAIRRLDLAIGQSADILTAYVTVPDLTVGADPQRYSRLGKDLYRYESRDSDFARDLVVDVDGLVLDYPGLFRRL